MSGQNKGFLLGLAVAAVIGAIAVIGVVAYRVQATVLKQTEFDRLQAIAQLKVDDISRWMNGRRANAELARRGVAVELVLAGHGDPIYKAGLEAAIAAAGLKVKELNVEITVDTAIVRANWRKN